MLRTDYDTLLGAEPSGHCYHRMGLSDTDEGCGEMGRKGSYVSISIFHVNIFIYIYEKLIWTISILLRGNTQGVQATKAYMLKKFSSNLTNWLKTFSKLLIVNAYCPDNKVCKSFDQCSFFKNQREAEGSPVQSSLLFHKGQADRLPK